MLCNNIHNFTEIYTGGPRYNTISQIQSRIRVSYPNRAISKVSKSQKLNKIRKNSQMFVKIKIFYSDMFCGYISLVLAYNYPKLNYFEYLKHYNPKYLLHAAVIVDIEGLIQGRKLLHACIRRNAGRFGPISVPIPKCKL